MGWYGGFGPHMWGPWFFAGPLFGLLWLAAIAIGVYLLLRYLRDGRADRARDILDERYARGELTTDEYRERLEHLR
jgi:putative membrane protein